MDLLDASAGRMVSGGESFFASAEGDWGPVAENGTAGGQSNMDNALAGAAGIVGRSAGAAFVGGFLEGAGLASETGPFAVLAGLVVGGLAYVGAKKALTHH